MLNYIAALLTLSTKDFLSHLFTIQPADDMVICSLNVRGLSNNTKRRETFLWLKKKSSLFTFCKRCIAQMRQNLIGILNGDQIRLFFTTFSSSRGGVAILFNNYFQFQILKHFADPEGRYIITDRYWGQSYDTSTLSTRLTRTTQPSLETCMTSCAPLNALL